MENKEILDNIGFIHFYGMTPAINILDQEKYDSETVNILVSGTSDIRHILKTLTDNFRKDKGIKNINFYMQEKQKEPFARMLVLLEILHMANLNYNERKALFLDIYANCLMREKSQQFLDLYINNLIRFITEDKRAKTVLSKIVNFKGMKYKEKDDLVDIIKTWHSNVPFSMEKLRDQRIRYVLKTRYDYKKNLIDWDYQMNIKEQAKIIHFVHYKEWRLTGVAYEQGFSSYIVPNRTMASYLPGKQKKDYTSCLVRGYWGDIINSPYIGFGVECDYEDLLFKIANQQQVGNSRETTDYNLEYYLNMLDQGLEYFKIFDDPYRKKDSKRKWKMKQGKTLEQIEKEEKQEELDKEKKQEEEEQLKQQIPEDQEGEEEAEEEEKKQEQEQEEQKKEEKIEMSEKALQKEQQLNEQMEQDQQSEDHSSLSFNQDNNDSKSEISDTSTKDHESIKSNSQLLNNSQQQDNDIYVETEQPLLQGFEKFNVQVYPLFDDLETLLKKKKWENFFDAGVVGFTMNGQFTNKDFNKIFKKNAIVFTEKMNHVACVKNEQREELCKKLVQFSKDAGFKELDYNKNHHFKLQKL